jgi:hypothetical protein
MVPYPDGSGSGHAGNDTSRERQERNDASGVTSMTQRAVYAALGVAKSDGFTALDVELGLKIGHGGASSALSHLHRAGKVKRIKMRRNRHEIYVLPEYVNGREESPYRPRNKPARHVRDLPDATVLEAMRKADIAPTRLESIRKLLSVLP